METAQLRSCLPQDLGEIRSALVLFMWGLGDHVMAVPAMRALGHILPGRVHLLCSRSAPDLFFQDAGLASITTWPMNFADQERPVFEAQEVAAQLGYHDICISLVNTCSSDWQSLVDCMRPSWRINAPRNAGSITVASDSSRHAMDEYFAVPQLLRPDLRLEDFAFPFPLPKLSIDFAASFRAALDGRKILVIHGETKANKCWHPDRLGDVLHSFSHKRPEYALVEIAREGTAIGQNAPAHLLRISGLPIASGIALAATADIALSVDSLFLHVADMWRVPSVGLFGSTSAQTWGFRLNPHGRHISAVGMDSLEVEPVLTALEELAAFVKDNTKIGKSLIAGAPLETLRWE